MNELEAHEYQVFLNDSIRLTVDRCLKHINNLIDNCPAMAVSTDNTSDQNIRECIYEAILNCFGDTIQGMESDLTFEGYDATSYTPKTTLKLIPKAYPTAF